MNTDKKSVVEIRENLCNLCSIKRAEERRNYEEATQSRMLASRSYTGCSLDRLSLSCCWLASN